MGYSSPPKLLFAPPDLLGNFFMGPMCSAHFFYAIAQNGKISKFTKYGHVVYHLISFLKLINEKSLNILKNVFASIYKHFFTLVSMFVRRVAARNRLRGYRVTNMVIV